ncbi:MAG TPA: GMC family oxidoreductase [Edaphobacter sp.]|nr:GMC family oxidoreductase [Edaphobacter sp.]
MIRDLLQSQPESSTVADVCIVGAGAAGIVLAVDLARRGKRVLLLEGGGNEIEEASQDSYRSELTGLPHRGIHSGRFRAKGGTTNKWGGQILELDVQDFEQRPWIAESGWPFPKHELARFYERALEYEGLADVTREDEAVWREIGMRSVTFPSLVSYFSRWCPEPNFARLHRRTIEEHPGITLWLHANAVEPLLEGEMMRGLRCRTLSGKNSVFRAGRFIFCLGGIESSRFFLQPHESGRPWNQSGLLGKHFQDHIDCNAAIVKPIDATSFHRIFDNVFSRGFKYHPKLRLSDKEQASRGTLNVAATMSFVSDVDETMMRLKSVAKHLLRGRIGELGVTDAVFTGRHLPLIARQAYRYKLQKRAYNPPESQIFLRVHCEQEPTSRSSITLSEKRDALGLLRTNLDWRISGKELDTIKQYVQVATRSLAGIAHIIPDNTLLSGNADFLSRCDDSNHHMGGMRMSSSPTNGIVNPDLRLYGVNNVYVCSSAVFPTSGFSNPTHTVLALAMRLGEHLD